MVKMNVTCTDSDSSDDSRGHTGVTNRKPDVSVTLVKFEATYLGTGRTLMIDLKSHKNILHCSKCAHFLEITM
jgi:hypothetical protein